MTYSQVINYLESFVNYEKIPAWPYKESLKPERIKKFLRLIGNPQDNLRFLHVAGTKGKGSTCAFLTYILREAGYKVGLYTSPHLSDFRERIRILQKAGDRKQKADDFEGMITRRDLALLVKRLKPAIEKYNRNSVYGPLSFFEVYTALAFVYFKEKKVDFAVLETGLGGRLDATNVVSPLVCVITPISYEHTQKLGNTLSKIAAEKAGIIKSNRSIVISASQEREAAEVIRKRCHQTGARLYEVGRDIKFEVQSSKFKVQGVAGEYPALRIRLLGAHQLVNAAGAVGAIEALGFSGINIDVDSIRRGLYNTRWPARCEVIAKNPLVVLDGAQNIASAGALKSTIKENFKYKRLILVLGISNDKDIKGICNVLCNLADEVILTKADNPRATKPEDLAKYFNDRKQHITNNVPEALGLAQKEANREDLILITGSLFVTGQARGLFKR
ncbi:MAG: bifunctional folylpolyglutamate synthase/dihydrofolate synthase [Candidatus Omnitrophica bacterium]|nr:bifunctional folylpolyglutamate synthase/dihydrofolate synthase [Candidatus Omnitrophota bacterium]